MNYFYARVSSKDQNLDRQIEAVEDFAKKNKIKINEIFTDKQSGKDFNRPNYLRMRGKLSPGDLVIIKSIDRLGRNYEMIIEEWSYLTKTLKCDIVVIDLSQILDTRTKQNGLTGQFISDLVLQILSYVSQTERENIKQRQAEGIKIAKEKGVKFGKESKLSEKVWKQVRAEYEDGAKILSLSKKYRIARASIYQKIESQGWTRNYEL